MGIDLGEGKHPPTSLIRWDCGQFNKLKRRVDNVAFNEPTPW
jgi:hypothetical protein